MNRYKPLSGTASISTTLFVNSEASQQVLLEDAARRVGVVQDLAALLATFAEDHPHSLSCEHLAAFSRTVELLAGEAALLLEVLEFG